MRISLPVAISLILLSGCTSPTSPEAIENGHATVVYRVEVTSESTTDELDVTLGEPFVAETTYPGGDRKPALIRPLTVQAIALNEGGPGSGLATLYAACDGEPGFCATAIAIDPSTGVPIRIFHTPIEVFTRSPLEDGSADSAFLSARNDIGFWWLTPIFIGHIWQHSDGVVNKLYDRSVTLSGVARGDTTDLVYHTASLWHDVVAGDNVSVTMSAMARLQGNADPVSASLTHEEESPDHSASIRYQFTRTEASANRIEWPTPKPNERTDDHRSPCGQAPQGPLFAQSILPYAKAFAPVQEDPEYRDAQEQADAILAAARLPPPGSGNPLESEPRIWEFDVQLKGTMTTYLVEERYSLPDPVPPTEEFVLLTKSPGEPHATTSALTDHLCVPWSQMEQRITRYLEAIGADGYRQVIIDRFPPDLAFRYVDGQRIPEAEAYTLNIQPFVDDGNGNLDTGPRMAFSLITGDLTRIT